MLAINIISRANRIDVRRATDWRTFLRPLPAGVQNHDGSSRKFLAAQLSFLPSTRRRRYSSISIIRVAGNRAEMRRGPASFRQLACSLAQLVISSISFFCASMIFSAIDFAS